MKTSNIFDLMTKPEKIVYALLLWSSLTFPALSLLSNQTNRNQNRYKREPIPLSNLAKSEGEPSPNGEPTPNDNSIPNGEFLTFVNDGDRPKEFLVGELDRRYPTTYQGFRVCCVGMFQSLDSEKSNASPNRGELRLEVESSEKTRTFGVSQVDSNSIQEFCLTVPKKTFPCDATGVALTLRLIAPPKTRVELLNFYSLGLTTKETSNGRVAPPKLFGIDSVVLTIGAAFGVVCFALLFGITTCRLEPNARITTFWLAATRWTLFAAGVGLFVFARSLTRFAPFDLFDRILLLTAVQWAFLFSIRDYFKTRAVKRRVERRKMEAFDTV